MIYPTHFETKVGFDRIRAQVASLCTTEAALALLEAEQFSSDSNEVMHRITLADEMRTILQMESGFPGGEFTDIAPLIAKAAVEGAFLEAEELLALGHALRTVAEIIDFLAARSESSYPALKEYSRDVDSFPAITGHITTLIDRFGQVKDSASPELYELRRTIRSREGEVSKRMQRILQQAQQAGIVESDASLSVRDGRTVIPVTAANKRKLQGFIHDESASGKTFYIEPVEIVEINNELKELSYAERREVVRILTEFTESLRPDLDAIANAGRYLAGIDLIRAKARWAVENSCVKPILSDDGRVVLRQARHPLLAQTLLREGKPIVPLDMQLDPEQRILVISGPNAGGKSVCLKTVSLVQYMFQCGFLVPALENSELPVFRSLLIDIGDEQSIENDLSTYSSHLLNMKQMLQHADERTMIFIDEFGSGTEPIIGGAIAESILEKLVEKGAYGVVTTHYANIKYFASTHPGVANGAMMFDVQQIRPLFRLEQGKPGSSFAIEIARKIGLPEEIIRQAGEKAGSDHISLEKQLREIARDRRYWEQKRDRIRLADRKVEQLEQDYADRLTRIKEERSQIIRAAKEEASRLMSEANRQIENTIRTIRESQAEKELTRSARRELEAFREKVEQVDGPDPEQERRIESEMERILRRRERRKAKKATAKEAEPAEPEPKERAIVPGSKVRLRDQDTVGEVVSIKGNKATIAFGQILSTLPVERIEAVSNAEYKSRTRPSSPRTVIGVEVSERKLNFRNQIDLRGMRAAEALDVVQNYIDDAIMVGIHSVSILHGKGTGALKEEIRRYLKTVDEIESARDEQEQLGGAGITVVTFKQ